MQRFRTLKEVLRDGYLITDWYQGPKMGPRFDQPESSFISGIAHSGKSRLLTRLGLMHQKYGLAQLVDAFGAENDSESTVHLLNPETRDNTLMIVGNEVKVEGWDVTMPVGEFTLERAKDYDVIVTDRALFGPRDERKYDFRYYAALARLFELAKRREGQKRLLVLAVREAWNLVYSQMKSGVSRDEVAAQGEFKKLHNIRFHANVAPILDSQYDNDVAANVRKMVDNKYIKGYGIQPIPNDIKFIFKPELFMRADWLIRNTPRDEFVLLRVDNSVWRGIYADIPWHIEKGHSPLKRLGITVSLKAKEDAPGAQSGEWGDAEWVPSNNDLHRRMMELHNQGFPYKEIAAKMTEEGVKCSWEKVRYHLQGQCSCEIAVGAQPVKGPMDQGGTKEQT